MRSFFFFFSSRRRHTRFKCDWSSDVCSSDLLSAATLLVVVWRWLRPTIAVPATMVFIGALSVDPYSSLLINPSLTALPDVITAAAILCYGLSGQRRFMRVAAFALGAA